MLQSGINQPSIDADLIMRLFSRDSDDAHRVRTIVCRVREGIERIDPFIQESTSLICPACKDVCCRNKHGYHNEEDLIYLYALGIEPPPNSSGREDTDPCHFISDKGCSLERTLRPSGCNWYFCDSLYDHMEKQSGYEEFDKALGNVAELWMQMIGEFRKLTGGYRFRSRK